MGHATRKEAENGRITVDAVWGRTNVAARLCGMFTAVCGTSAEETERVTK
jgi:hypothetical protein